MASSVIHSFTDTHVVRLVLVLWMKGNALVSADRIATSPARLCPHCVAQQPHSELPDRLNTAQAARYTGLADATLRYYRHANIGPESYRIGSKVFYDRVSLDAWQAEQPAASVRGGSH